MGGGRRGRRCNLESKVTSASASEGGEILKLKKEALEAIKAKMDRLLAMEMMPAEEPAGAGEKKKKVKVVKKRVSKSFIDLMKARHYGDYSTEIPEEVLARRSKEFRDFYEERKVIREKISAYQRALLHQYEANGYAVDETEVTDEEEEGA